MSNERNTDISDVQMRIEIKNLLPTQKEYEQPKTQQINFQREARLQRHCKRYKIGKR